MVGNDPSDTERAGRMIRTLTDRLRSMTPQERDRTMQIHLAQARGVVRNGDLLRQAVDRALEIEAVRREGTGGERMNDALIDTLSAVVDALESSGAAYAITGSVASSVHGEPYSTVDADLVAIATPGQAAAVAGSLTPRFYAPEDILAQAARDHGFTNVVDNRTGLKVDVSFVGDDVFLRTVLTRRIRHRIGSHPREFWMVTPEDVILMKLLWQKDTRSAKQWENALGVVRVKGARMDWKYLFEQARSLGIEDDLIKLRDEAGV